MFLRSYMMNVGGNDLSASCNLESSWLVKIVGIYTKYESRIKIVLLIDLFLVCVSSLCAEIRELIFISF